MNLNPKENDLAVGYGMYSIDLDGTPPCDLSTFTSGSKPEKLVITNKLLAFTKTFKDLT